MIVFAPQIQLDFIAAKEKLACPPVAESEGGKLSAAWYHVAQSGHGSVVERQLAKLETGFRLSLPAPREAKRKTSNTEINVFLY